MIAELGHYALILALCFAGLQVAFSMIAVITQQSAYLSLIRSMVWGQFSFVALSFILLMLGFALNDFSLQYVAANSNRHLPMMYRLGAVWGAHEGSMLLWVLILSAWTTLVAAAARLPALIVARVLMVLGLVAVGFYVFILTTSNPFLRLLANIPLNGRDLNPLLQDPGLISHPPLLYMGYVGLSVPFAFAIAALWTGRFDQQWARWTRPWALLSWCFLTLGIVLGSWWAYRELGWGGWWFWDPVENASFLPWLAATALIHSLMVVEKRQQFKSWTVFLAICAFSLSLIGTFLVRSGVLISVHAFAVDPRRGSFIFAFLCLVIGVSLALYAWRGHRLAAQSSFRWFSRESFLLSNNMLLFVAMLTILLGTLYPLLVDVLGWGKISVGAPYFNTVFIPIFTPIVFLMGLAPFSYWRYRDPVTLYRQIIIVFILALLLAVGIVVLGWHAHYWSILGLFLAAWLIIMTVYYRLQSKSIYRWGVFFAHGGLAIMLIGIVVSHSLSDGRDLRLHLGERAKLGPYVFQLISVSEKPSDNYRAAEAKVRVLDEGVQVAVLSPQYRIYPVAQTAMSKTDIAINWRRDLYVALAQPFEDGSWSMRVYYKPFVRWIWFGGLLMVLGGLCAIAFRPKSVVNQED